MACSTGLQLTKEAKRRSVEADPSRSETEAVCPFPSSAWTSDHETASAS